MNNVYKIFTQIDDKVLVQRIIMRLNQLVDTYSRFQVEAAIATIELRGYSKNEVLTRHLVNLRDSYAPETWNDALNILELNVIKQKGVI